MTALAELEKLAPCEIEYGVWDGVDNGMYNNCYAATKQPLIRINDSMNDDAILLFLAHEIGHATCEIKNCRCMRKVRKTNMTNLLCEYHANRFAMKWLYMNKHIGSLKHMLKMFKHHLSIINPCSVSKHYVNASKRLMKKRIWRKCLKLIGEK